MIHRLGFRVLGLTLGLFGTCSTNGRTAQTSSPNTHFLRVHKSSSGTDRYFPDESLQGLGAVEPLKQLIHG